VRAASRLRKRHCVVFKNQGLNPVKFPRCHSIGALLGFTANLIAAETWPGTEPRFFCCPTRGAVTEPTELFRLLYFVMTTERSLEFRAISQPYP
jgi:hypothetical protein